MRIWGILLAVALFVAPSAASAGEVYVSGIAGWSVWPDTSNKDPVEAEDWRGYLFGAEAGCEFRSSTLRMRAGLEGVRRSNETHGKNPRTLDSEADGTGTVYSVMVNLWPSTEVAEGTHLYLGGGLGYGHAEFFGDEDTAPAFQFGLGFRYELTEDYAVGIGYRYFLLGDTEHDGFKASYDSHGGFIEISVTF